MPSSLHSAPVMVALAADLERLAEQFSNQTILAVDTESNSLHAYRERVCLLQFSTLDNDYLVDPLLLPGLEPLAPIFADPKIEKVFHAAEYDVLCLVRDFSFAFANLFDTMLAARILGRKAFGLGPLLQSEFGVTLDKHYQRADWGLRPLTPEMLKYARLDSHYLIALRDRLREELISGGRWPLAEEDFRRLTQLQARSNEPEPANAWNVSGAFDLKPQQAAVLKELLIYRDHVASRMDRPWFKVIGDKTLMAIAEACPTRPDELAALLGMSHGQMQRHGRHLLQAVQRGLQAPPIVLHRPAQLGPIQMARMDALRRWRKAAADTMGVESDIVLPRDLMFVLMERAPNTPEELAEMFRDVPWRLEHFGDETLAVLKPFRRR